MKQLGDIKAFQELHLDTMIKLSFDMDDAEEIAELVGSPDPELSIEEQMMADRILQESFRRIDENKKSERRTKNWVKTKQIVPKIIQAAACLVLIIGIALPIAFATSAEFRARVMKLVIEFNDAAGEAHFSFQEDPASSFYVPEGWKGNHFPSQIPKGYVLHDFDPFFTEAEYRSENGGRFYYSEYDEYTQGLTGTENADVFTTMINGREAYVIDGIALNGVTHTITISWSNDTNWFVINTYDIELDEAISIANSVKRIVK